MNKALNLTSELSVEKDAMCSSKELCDWLMVYGASLIGKYDRVSLPPTSLSISVS